MSARETMTTDPGLVNDPAAALKAWDAVRPQARVQGDALEVLNEGAGGYVVSFDFSTPGVIAVKANDPLGPSADPEYLERMVDEANAKAGAQVFEISGPLVLCCETLTRGPGGISLAELEAARSRVVALLDEHHAAFAAPGRTPFSVHVDHDGHATLIVTGRLPRSR
jgi:hypothetical protein